MSPPCYNREFPKTVTVQDGWEEVGVPCADSHGEVFLIRVPRMVEIPFKFTMEDGCPQWKPPAGAVVKGIVDEAECEGCKWKPRLFDIEVMLRFRDGTTVNGIKGDDWMFVMGYPPMDIESIYYRTSKDGEGVWHPAEVDWSSPEPPVHGDTVKFRRKW